MLQTPHAERPVTVAEGANTLEDNRYGNDIREIPIDEEPKAYLIEVRNGYKGGSLPRTEVPE